MKRGKIEGFAMDSRTMMEMTLNLDEQDASWVCERWCHWLYCPPNIFRMTSDRKCLEKTDIARKANPRTAMNCQLYVMEFCHFAFCFGITSHSLTEHVFFFLSLCCSKVRRFF
jgi:hypothetical protein